MNKSAYEYNNIDLVVVKNPEYYTVCATQYYYRKLGGVRTCVRERTWRWKTQCKELISKMDQRRTKVFTGQLVQLAKQYGAGETLIYKDWKRYE